jgi:acetyl-CoA carboxylase carboxyl transferase subunit beta
MRSDLFFKGARGWEQSNTIESNRADPDTMDRRRCRPKRKQRMTWFKREDNAFGNDRRKTVRTEGLWIQCGSCRLAIFKKDLEENLNVCPKCGHHFRINARARINLLLEAGYELVDTGLRSTDPLDFTDLKRYQHRLAEARKKTGLNDAILTALGKMGPHDVVLSAMEYGFIGGSMGAVVGETIARAIDRSLATRHPLVIVAASGGARMMEGIVSLMQLAKIASGLARLDEERIPYLSVATDPTFGGVTACFAMLGDLNISEPGALIGFAGPRVIEQTTRTKLPEGFQRAEFLLEHGFIDAIVERKDMKNYLIQALGWMVPEAKTEAAAQTAAD